MAVKEICKKHKGLIRRLGIHAPLEERESFGSLFFVCNAVAQTVVRGSHEVENGKAPKAFS